MRRLAFAFLLLTTLAGCAASGGPGLRRPAQAASVDRGLFFVLRACAGCHAVDAASMSPTLTAPPFAIIRLRHDGPSLERLLTAISKDGHHSMPPIYMTEREIRDVAAYIRTVEPVAPAQEIVAPEVRETRFSPPAGAIG